LIVDEKLMWYLFYEFQTYLYVHLDAG